MIKINYVQYNTKEEIYETIGMVNMDRCYFLDFLSIYLGRKFVKDEFVPEIIKVFHRKDQVLDELLNGISYNGNIYKELYTSPSGQKAESNGYCIESIYYNATKHPDLRETYWNTISNGGLNQLESKEISIAKQVSSRISLGGSSSIGSIKVDMKKVVLVPDSFYDYTGNFSYFQDNTLVEGEKTLNLQLGDGCGLMSLEIAEEIQSALKLNYKVQFVTGRIFPIAMKGLLIAFDFKNYLKQHNINKITDIYGIEHNIEDIDIIINESQAKWSNLFDNINNITNEGKYNSINNKLYICKVNQNPKDFSDIIQLNYQLLQNLSITKEDLLELAKDDILSFKSLIDDADFNKIRICLGARDGSKSSLALMLDKLGKESLEIPAIKKIVYEAVNNSIKKLSGGRISCEGNLCIVAPDPISYINAIVGITTAEELGDGIVQGGNKNSGLEVATFRSPISSFQNIQKHEFSSRAWAEGYTPELLFIGKNIMLLLSDGADTDGDIVFITTNSIIRNNVIDNPVPFINELDDKSLALNMEYSYENYCKSLILGSGNKVGTLATLSGKLLADITSYSNLVNKDGQVCSYSELKDCWLRKIKKQVYGEDSITDERFRQLLSKQFEQYLKDNNLIQIRDLSSEEQKQYIIRMFNFKRPQIFKLLQLQMWAVDSAKTCQPCPDELLHEVKAFTHNLKKPIFLKVLDKANDFEVLTYTKNNPLDSFYAEIMSSLYYPLKEQLSKSNVGSKKFYEMFAPVSPENISEELYKIYKKNRDHRKDMTSEEKRKADTLALMKNTYLNPTPEEIVATCYYKKISIRYFLEMFHSLVSSVLNNMPSKCLNIIPDATGTIQWRKKRFSTTILIDNTIDIKQQLAEFRRKKIVKTLRVYKEDGITVEDLPINGNIEITNCRWNNLTFISPRNDKIELPENGTYMVVGTSIDREPHLRASIYIINSEKIN